MHPTASRLADKRRFVATLVPSAVLMVIAFFAGCGARDWDRKLINGYQMMSPYSGMVVVYNNDVPSQSQCSNFESESVCEYSHDARWIALRLEPFDWKPDSPTKTIEKPYALIDTATHRWQRFETRTELIGALPVGVTLPKWKEPTNPLFEWCCWGCAAAVALPGAVVLVVCLAMRRKPAGRDELLP